MRKHFFRIEPVVSDKKLESYLTACRKSLGKWFGIDVLMPHVFFIQSRKDFDRIMGRKTKPWMTGATVNGNIFILDPKKYSKVSVHKRGHFWKVLKHEYAHIYPRALTSAGNKPRWLHEGLACYLAKQEKKRPDDKYLLDLDRFFDRSGEQIYGVGYFWVKYLIEKYGKAKLLKLLKTIDAKTTKTKFGANFKKIYGFGLNKKSLSSRVK